MKGYGHNIMVNFTTYALQKTRYQLKTTDIGT